MQVCLLCYLVSKSWFQSWLLASPTLWLSILLGISHINLIDTPPIDTHLLTHRGSHPAKCFNYLRPRFYLLSIVLFNAALGILCRPASFLYLPRHCLYAISLNSTIHSTRLTRIHLSAEESIALLHTNASFTTTYSPNLSWSGRQMTIFCLIQLHL